MKTKNKGMLVLCILVLLSIAVLGGCGQNGTGNSTEIPPIDAPMVQQLTYSNLVDVASQQEVRDALREAGIQEAAIDEFFGNVNEFNELIENKTLATQGFVTLDRLIPEYDIAFMMETLAEKKPEAIGYNCRLTSFGLMKDRIQIGRPIIEDENSLFIDLEAIETNPVSMNDQEKQVFMSLFSHIPTKPTAEVAEHVQVLKENYKTKQIRFLNTDSASLVSVYFHFMLEDESTLFIGHMGILLPTKDGKLLFIEKLSFQEPYQAIRFHNRRELSDYLMNRYDTAWGQPTARPFIMENGELMEGYRPNPNNDGTGEGGGN